MKERIEVTAKFDDTGRVTPLRFSWKERRYRIDSWGRRWEDPDGLHILVMIPRGRVFQLLFDRQEGVWYLEKGGPPESGPAA
jgi:hypothetical protein